MARMINAIKKLITAVPEDENSLQRRICQLESENEELRENLSTAASGCSKRRAR